MAGEAFARIGKPATRIDGPAKVTGAARYPSDEPLANPAYAVLVTSAVAKGRLAGLDLAAAKAVPGVLDILTHDNVGGQVKPPAGPSGQGSTTITLESDRVWHDGQIIAVVVAETFEAAKEAAGRVKASYAAETPSAGFDSAGITEEDPSAKDKQHEHPKKGDADAAFAAAPVKIDARYATPTQHHNPMELFTTSCVWSGDKLTIYEPSQFVHGLRGAIAKQLGLEPDKVRVVSRFIGGAFGSKGGATARTAWIAIAARRIGRPVKLVASRDQGFTIATYRAETRQRVKLAAGKDGKLLAVIHEGREVTSRPNPYNVSGVETTARLYASPNIRTGVTVVHADRNTPGFMRAPPETPYMFAFESGMDELAVALGMDPIELRRVNDTLTDPISGKPYTSRSLMRCFDEGAKAFDWSRRDPTPGATRDGDWLVGYGCATAAYSSNIAAAACRVSLGADGKARVQMGAHDLGTGAYTVLAITVADRLGLRIADVKVEIGDTDLPPAGLAAGSNHTASITNVVAKACEDIRARLAAAAVAPGAGALAGQDPASLKLREGRLVGASSSEPLAAALKRLGGGRVEVYAENLPSGAPPDGLDRLHHDQMAMSPGGQRPEGPAYAFGAQFVEVRVHSLTGEIRAPRALGAFAAGTIVNPLTARSQYMGGMIWGIGAALHEATEIDPRAARYTNDNLADYLMPVNADIGRVDVVFVEEEDRIVNPLGVKGIGEIGIVGMNAAVANAVFNATGKRVRELPIRIEDMF
jgi:xanthine dehydrogenase YagR molybdenum-binding subunit